MYMCDKSIFNIEELCSPSKPSEGARAPAGIVSVMEKYFSGNEVRILEIGVFKAGLTKLFASSSLNIISYDGVDPYLGSDDDPYTGAYWDSPSDADKIYLSAKKYYDSKGYSLHRMTSAEYFDSAYKSKEYDIIYVDGDHRMYYAMQDMEEYIHLLAENGIMLVDDYGNVDTPEVTHALNRFIDNRRDVIKEIGYYISPFQNVGKYIPVSQTTVYFTADKGRLNSGFVPKRYNISEALKKLVNENGIKRIALFGVGRYTEWMNDVFGKLNMPCIAAVLDDYPDKTKIFWGHAPVKASEWDTTQADAIILSSDCKQEMMRERCRELFGDALPLIDLYEGLPAGPFPK